MTGTASARHYGRPAVVQRYVDARDRGLTDRERRAVDAYFTPNASVLDLGCGAGRTTADLAALGFDVTGVDVSAAMVDAARSAGDDAAYVVADAAHLPFVDGAFDHVLFSYNGLDELRPVGARNAALREAHRVLAPGGRLAFSTRNVLRQFVPYPPTADHLAALARFWAANARAALAGSPYKRPTGNRDDRAVFFTNPVTVVRRLTGLGFDVLAFLGNDGRASTYLGPALFVVAQKPRR